jgi:hypothetical protein
MTSSKSWLGETMLLIKAQHLMTLMNRLGDRVMVGAPMLGCHLFALDLSGRIAQIHDVIRFNEYQPFWQSVRSRASQGTATTVAAGDADAQAELARSLGAEVPDSGRLRDAFRQAGVIEPENLDEIRALFQQARKSNPARGGDVYYFAFDNNALRNRLYSQFLRTQSPRDPHFNFVVAKQVRNELDCREGKVLGDFQKALDLLLPGFSVASVFANQNRLQDRLRLLALAEWNVLLASGDSVTVATGEEKDGAPLDSDLIIIGAYAQFAAQPGRKVVLFSSDNEFVAQSTGRANLIGQLVRYPAETMDRYETPWENACRLLYQLAVVYGRLDLKLPGGESVLMYGVWQNKTADDLESERVRVTMDTSSSSRLADIHDAVARDIEILNEAVAT